MPPPPAEAFYQNGITDLGGEFLRLTDVTKRARAGDGRYARLLHEGAGVGFIAHSFDNIRGRTDKHDPRGGALSCKLRVFGEKAVAGVNGARTRAERGADYILLIEIARARGGTAHADTFVGKRRVK